MNCLTKQDFNNIFKNITKLELFSSNNKSIYKKILTNIDAFKINLQDNSLKNIIKLGVIYFNPEIYKCFNTKCSIKDKWLDEPLSLILKNKNNKSYDNRIENIEFYCPNCYFTLFKSDQLHEIISENKIKCQFCDYENVHQLGKYYIENRICKICSNKKTQVINIENEINDFDMGLNSKELEKIDNFLLEEKLNQLDLNFGTNSESNLKSTKSSNPFDNYNLNDNIEELLANFNPSQHSSSSSSSSTFLIDNQVNFIEEDLDINNLLDI